MFRFIILAVFALSGCTHGGQIQEKGSSTGSRLKAKSVSQTSLYPGRTVIDRFDGLQLFRPGNGINSLNLEVNAGESSKTTWDSVRVTLPIVVEWTLIDTDGTVSQKQMSYSEFAGLISNGEINEECTIWVFFDEKGDLLLKYFPGDSMVGRTELFDSIGRDR